MSAIAVKEIHQINERTLGIEWTDGKVQSFDVVNLRRICPCAVCIDEHTGKQILDPLSVKETIRPINIHNVGAYGLQIQFSDGHGTGIYTFDRLRSLHQTN